MKEPAFRHARRTCHWCEGGFQPLTTLSPYSTEHFCSSECAFARHQAKALDVVYPGAYQAAQDAAREARRQWSAEVALRLRAGKERKALQVTSQSGALGTRRPKTAAS